MVWLSVELWVRKITFLQSLQGGAPLTSVCRCDGRCVQSPSFRCDLQFALCKFLGSSCFASCLQRSGWQCAAVGLVLFVVSGAGWAGLFRPQPAALFSDGKSLKCLSSLGPGRCHLVFLLGSFLRRRLETLVWMVRCSKFKPSFGVPENIFENTIFSCFKDVVRVLLHSASWRKDLLFFMAFQPDYLLKPKVFEGSFMTPL